MRTDERQYVQCYVGLGSNLGDRQANIDAALELMGGLPDTSLIRASSLMENPAFGSTEDAGDFLNGVASLETTLDASVLLGHLLRIERELGRDRTTANRNAPRTIDLDLLLYGDEVIVEDDLEVPHPRMLEREFVLWPLLQIASKLKDPRTGEPFADAYQRVKTK